MQYEPTANASLEFLLPLNGTRVLNGTPRLPSGSVNQLGDQQLSSLAEQVELTRFIAQRILVPIIVAIGVVGNLLNIVVLTRRWMRSSTNYYLTALAVCDVLYLIFAFTQSLKHYEQIKSQPWFIRYRQPFGKPFADIFSNSAVWLTLTFTVERYINVCHPMKGKRWCTPLRACYIIIIVSFSATLITFPEFFESVVRETFDSRTNTTRPKVETTKFGQADAYQFAYMYLNQALFTILPLLLLLIFNSLLINAVMQAAKQRRAMSYVTVVRNERHERQSREQQKITIMLISVVIVFLVCQLPQAITNLYVSYLKATEQLSTDRKRLYRLIINNNACNILVMINASINFILYSSFSTKFRGTFKRLFCSCVAQKNASQLFTEFVSMTGHGPHTVGDKKYSVSFSATRSTSITTTSSVGKPLLKNGTEAPKRDFSACSLNSAVSQQQMAPTARKKNGYLEVGQEPDNSDNHIENIVSSL